ncbi:hypothetical protein ABPG72_021747 [Tetrahymena utriculariae]
MDSEIYCSILENELKKSADRLFQRKKWILIEDNDPKHTSRASKAKREELNIERLDDWPASSPDLNPVENIWNWLKHQVEKERVTTKEQLVESIQNNWNLIDIDFISPFIQSFPNRLQMVINNQGLTINY